MTPLCNAASYQPGGVWCQIFDGKRRRRHPALAPRAAPHTTAFMQMGMPLDDFIAMDGGTGLMQKADSLTSWLCCSALKAKRNSARMDTIAHYNDIVESCVETDYGKGAPPPLEDYRAALLRLLVRGALLTTLDGMRINEDMQALTADGSVIEGLYAAGDVWLLLPDNYPEYIVACACWPHLHRGPSCGPFAGRRPRLAP